jgi:hypothetical protein
MRDNPRAIKIIALGLVLSAAAAGAVLADPGGKKNLIKVFMMNTGVDPDARGKFMFVENKAQMFFQVKASGMDPALPCEVVVDGAVMETMTMNSDGEARVSHRVRLKGRHAGGTLPYDPRGAELALRVNGADVLVAHVPRTPEEAFDRVEVEIHLLNLGVQPAAEAEAEFEARFGRMKFEVEVEGLLAGTYDLFVGGADVGDIVVAADGVEAEIEFDTRPCCEDEPGGMEEMLTFDPRGQLIEIKDRALPVPAVLFSGTL